MSDPDSILRPVKRTLGWLVAATVVLYIALGAIAVTSFQTAHTNKDALCTFRSDLQTRVQSSEQFLEENPKGIPGITAETIQQGIDNQNRTIEALDALNC